MSPITTPGSSPFADPQKREALMNLVGRAQALTEVGHGVVPGEPASIGSVTWATSAFDTLRRIVDLFGEAE